MNVLTQKQKTQGIRGPNLAVLVTSCPGVPMEEALRRADAVNAVIPPNKRLSRALVESSEWQDRIEVFPCWSGTMSAYERPDRKLGSIIEYADSESGIRYVFPVPTQYVGKKNVILVAEHPDFTLRQKGNDRIVLAEKVGIIEAFPVSVGWYLGDWLHGIPTGNPVDPHDEAARFLMRIEKRVGLAVRDLGDSRCVNGSRGVLMSYGPSVALGVAMEAV